MNARARIALPVVAVLLCAAMAGANPILDRALIAHYAPEITFSTDPPEGGWDQAYYASPVTSPEDLHLRIDVADSLGVVWYLLGAWYISTEFCGVEFGLGSYEAAAFVPVSAGPCFPGAGLETPGEGWPGPNAGTALMTIDIPWEGTWVPLYYFAGYAYADPGPTVIPLADNPSSGRMQFLTCETPPGQYPVGPGGSLGINTDGVAYPPTQFRACCHDGECTLESEIGCEMAGGVWLEDETDCDPDPCSVAACCVDEVCTLVTELACLDIGGHWMALEIACEPDNPCDKGACCLAAGCAYVWEDSCHALHPEVTGEFVPGEIWHPSGTCDPGTIWCYPSSIREASWGAMKRLYLEPGR